MVNGLNANGQPRRTQRVHIAGVGDNHVEIKHPEDDYGQRVVEIARFNNRRHRGCNHNHAGCRHRFGCDGRNNGNHALGQRRCFGVP